MRSTIARDVLFPWKMRQEIAETKLASVSYANRRKRSVSNGGRESLLRWTSIRSIREKKMKKILVKAARRDETKRSAQTRANAKYSRYPETVDNPVRAENFGAWFLESFLLSNYTFILKLNCFSHNIFNFIVFFFSDNWKFCWKMQIFLWILEIVYWKSIIY